MHFTLLVVGSDPQAALAPFQENNMGDCPEEFLTFFSRSAEHEREYNETQTFYKHRETGEVIDEHDRKLFRVVDAETYENYTGPRRGVGYVEGEPCCYIQDPAGMGYDAVEGTYALMYPTLEDFLQAEYADDWNEEAQDYGYFENAQAKWDWFAIGGRWPGQLILKKSAELTEENSIDNQAWCVDPEWSPYTREDGRQGVDSARICDVDWEFMDQEKLESLRERWDDFIGEQLRIKTEDELIEIYNEFKTDEPYEEWRDKRNSIAMRVFGVPLGATFDEYADAHGRTWSAYALLVGGEWYEGSDVAERIKQVIKDHPDQLVTVVDCHI